MLNETQFGNYQSWRFFSKKKMEDEPFIITEDKRGYSYFTASEINAICGLC